MANEFENKRKKTNIVLHSVYDYVMGVLWLSLGTVVLLHDKLRLNLIDDKILTTIFGVSAILYGLFRLYRGYKKNY